MDNSYGMMMVMTKCDLRDNEEKSPFDKDAIIQKVEEWNIPFIETSAKDRRIFIFYLNNVYMNIGYRFNCNNHLPQLHTRSKVTTGNKVLAEASNDKTWGIGVGLRNDKVFEKTSWTGDNVLGVLLMKVRQDIC